MKETICQNCRFWCLGTVSEYDKEFVWWAFNSETGKTEMQPHPNAGKIIKHASFPSNEHYGECTFARADEHDKPSQFFVIGHGETPTLITDPSHGCYEFADAEEGWGHWAHEIVRNGPRKEKE